MLRALSHITLLTGVFVILLNCSEVHAQERVTTFGIQFKPIVPFELLNTGKQQLSQENVDLTIDPRVGYALGMVIRAGLTKNLSFESGINYVIRNYRFSVFDNAKDLTLTSNMSFDGYEIPVCGLVFVRLNQKWYINSMFGASFDFYPTGGIVDNQQGYEIGIVETKWLQPSLLANLGAEYRTKKSGYFYFGFSFHRPFSTTADASVSERIANSNRYTRLFNSELSGNYLTLDFRYFFHEKPRNKK